MAQMSNILQRMMSLATEAASGQVTNTQRTQDIGTEYTQLSQQIDTIVSSTRYGGQSLLSGSFLSSIRFLVGTTSADSIAVSLSSLNASILGVTGSVNTTSQALAAITQINSAINIVTQQRAQVGAYEFALQLQLARHPDQRAEHPGRDLGDHGCRRGSGEVRPLGQRRAYPGFGCGPDSGLAAAAGTAEAAAVVI